MSESDCVKLQDHIYSHLLNKLPSHVASFGSLDGSTSDGWIAIINNKPTSKVRLFFVFFLTIITTINLREPLHL